MSEGHVAFEYEPQNVSPETMIKIDSEIRRLVKGGEDEARRILTEKLEDLHSVAKALLEFETLSGEEIIGVTKGVAPKRDEPEEKKPTGPVASVPVSPTGVTA